MSTTAGRRRWMSRRTTATEATRATGWAPDHALLVGTVYVGSGGQEPGVAVDVTLTAAGRATTHRVLPDVPVTHARGRCLSDHAAVVQSALKALKALTGAHVSVHVGDDAVLLTSQAFPPAADEPQQP